MGKKDDALCVSGKWETMREGDEGRRTLREGEDRG